MAGIASQQRNRDWTQRTGARFVNPRSWVYRCLFVSLLIGGCGEDESVAGPSRRGLSASQMKRIQKTKSAGPSKKKSQGASAAQGTVGKDVSNVVKIPNRLKRVELLKATGWDNFKRIRERMKEARDPFVPDIPELKDQDEVEVDPSSVQGKLVVKVPQPITNLEFKGTLTGMSSNLAMLEDGAGTGYTVRVGDIVGKVPEFVRVKMITNNKITFEPVLGIAENEPADSPRLKKLLREGQENSVSELGVEQ